MSDVEAQKDNARLFHACEMATGNTWSLNDHG